jgi:hypothetical protein
MNYNQFLKDPSAFKDIALYKVIYSKNKKEIDELVNTVFGYQLLFSNHDIYFVTSSQVISNYLASEVYTIVITLLNVINVFENDKQFRNALIQRKMDNMIDFLKIATRALMKGEKQMNDLIDQIAGFYF